MQKNNWVWRLLLPLQPTGHLSGMQDRANNASSINLSMPAGFKMTTQ